MAQNTQSHPRTGGVANPSITFHGVGTNGRFLLQIDGTSATVCGILYQLERIPKQPDDEKKRSKRHHISTTPGYQASGTRDQSLIAVCPTKKTRFRVIGQVHYVEPKPSAMSRLDAMQGRGATGSASMPHVADALPRDLLNHFGKTFAAKLAAIAALRAAGFDPDVRMEFITVYVNESRPNLYRKMGVTFPMPLKRGKGSFWPMSVIEAYKAGTWRPPE